ncbi:MAG: hypothetical protein QG595_1967 [Pseudomonadota bacterium]|nr:hypothetical protein [Pseudomonadota bacterium]
MGAKIILYQCLEIAPVSRQISLEQRLQHTGFCMPWIKRQVSLCCDDGPRPATQRHELMFAIRF